MKNILLILVTMIAFNSCQKNIEIIADDYLTFGSFYGECFGNDCVKLYVLQEDKLFEDPNDFSETLLSYITLSDEKFNKTKDLINYIPNELLDAESQTYGCPDCADQGGIYIRFVLDDKKGEFKIDIDKSAIPNYLHEFVDKVNEKLELL